MDFDPRWDILPQLQDIDGAPRVPGFNGTGLIQDKKPRLGEEQVRKVISHILEALMFLNDRTFAHQDMSHRNYLVDENLNVSMPVGSDRSVISSCG